MKKKLIQILATTVLVLGIFPFAFSQDEPALPSGLGDDEPSLPSGLDGGSVKRDQEKEEKKDSEPPFNLSYFLESRGGIRNQKDPNEKDFSMGEVRLQIHIEKQWESFGFDIVTDFLYDPVLDEHDVNLETGDGFLDLRSANISWTPASFIDLKVGRQVLTWGTGDLLFINDLFPKDWNSFFNGRDVEYLKAPSDAIKASLYIGFVNLDLVYTPRFDADRYIDGRRISYYNANLGRVAGRDAVVNVDKPDNWFEDDEFALRLFKNINGIELALYGYLGYWKSPGGQNLSGQATFPKLNVYGASVRSSVGNGIANIEGGFYHSRDDSKGDNPLINNSEARFLVGYEFELIKELNVGLQYYVEWMVDYTNYLATFPVGINARDEVRHLITLRLTQQMLSQKLILSLFTFFSPSDMDSYIRPKIQYKMDDHWLFEGGGNIFIEKNEHTFFGQFKKNTNVYLAIRYSGILL